MTDEEKIDLKAIGKRLQSEFGVEKAPLTDALRPRWPDAMRKGLRRGS